MRLKFVNGLRLAVEAANIYNYDSVQERQLRTVASLNKP